MCKLVVVVATAMALAAIPTSALSGKLSSDPNAPGAMKAVSRALEIDNRLQQKVSYTSGYKRLHAVADDLGKRSKVGIYGGANDKDWRVRDVPVVISARDIPLEKLLSAIAVCIHAKLRSESVGENSPLDQRLYRINRPLMIQQQIAMPLDPQLQRVYDDLSWSWDAVMRAASLPESDAAKLPRETQIVSKIVASLGLDAKEQIFSRSTVFVDMKKPTIAPLARELYGILSSRNDYKQLNVPQPPALDEVKDVQVRIYLQGREEDALVELVAGILPDGQPAGCQLDLQAQAYAVSKAKLIDLPERPLSKPISSAPEQAASPGKQWAPVADSKSPALDTKITLKPRPDGRAISYAEVLQSISEQCGYTIVCEDFHSHRPDSVAPASRMLCRDTPLRDELSKSTGFVWFINDEDQVMLGWEQDWPVQHRNLLPESVIANVKSRMDGDGLSLVDVARLCSYTDSQLRDWLFGDIQIKNGLFSLMMALPQASERVAGFFNEHLKRGSTLTPADNQEKNQETTTAVAALCDPSACLTTRLHVIGEPVPLPPGADKILELRAKRIYRIELAHTSGGKSFRTKAAQMSVGVPLYSTKKMNELIERLDKARTKSQ